MKSNLKSKLIGVTLLLCFVLTGCSGRTSMDYSASDYDEEKTSDYSDIGAETSNFVSDVTDTVSGVVSDTVSGITEGVVEDITDEAEEDADHLIKIKGRWGSQKKKTLTDQFTIKDVTAKSLQTDIDMGNVNVSYGKNDTAAVKVKYTASGYKKDVLDEILQTVGIDYTMEKDTLQVSIVNKNTEKNIWDWLHDKYHYYNLSVELDVTLPETVNEFNIDNSLGNISLNSVKGVFDIKNSLGNIDLNNVAFTGESEIEADLGKIDCSLSKDIKESSEVTMNNSLGDIHIDTNSLSYTENNDDSDENWGGSASKTILIKKLCEMNLDVDLGKITVK